MGKMYQAFWHSFSRRAASALSLASTFLFHCGYDYELVPLNFPECGNLMLPDDRRLAVAPAAAR